MTDFPKSIDCGDFRLEKVEPTFDTARYLFELVDSQREYMAEWLGWVDKSNCPEDMYMHMHKVSQNDNGSYYIIYNGDIVGSAGVDIRSKKNKIAEIGYWLSHDYNGRGIMTRAVHAMEKLAFDMLEMRRVEIRADVRNKKSCAVAERAGYVAEGVLRGAYILRDESTDVAVYSKLKSEWEKENKNA